MQSPPFPRYLFAPRFKSWYSVVSLGRCSLFPSRVGLRTYQHPSILCMNSVGTISGHFDAPLFAHYLVSLPHCVLGAADSHTALMLAIPRAFMTSLITQIARRHMSNCSANVAEPCERFYACLNSPLGYQHINTARWTGHALSECLSFKFLDFCMCSLMLCLGKGSNFNSAL